MIETIARVNLMVNEVLKIKKNRLTPDVLTGKERRISLVSGVYGDELQGQFVCYEVTRRIKENYKCLKGIVDIYPAINPLAMEAKTREILYAKGVARLLEGEDTLHIFVNHWPSKLGGASSAALRERIAKLLQRKADSIAEQNPSAKIILMGDFNDSPTGSAIAKLKGFRNLSQELQESLKKENTPAKASHKYNGRWEMLDQFLTRGIEGARADIFASPHLLQGDKKFLSQRIKRTFIGPRYNGGVSDHLPIVLIVCNPTDSSLRPEWNDKNSK